MKLPCEMVQDLLPLYHDGVCSEVSATLVGEHLKECEGCSRMLNNLDAEIQVPKMEADAAKPLLSIQLNWNRRKRKLLLKCLAAGAAVFALLAAGWWMLFKWYCVPVAPEEIAVFTVCELEDGSVFIETDVPYRDYYPCVQVTEEGVLYEWNKRPLLGEKLQPRRSGWIAFDPETDTWRDENGNSVLLTAYCLGEPGSQDVVILWEKGMELPAASERVEEEYQMVKDAYSAPNAPEEPDIITVVDMPPTSEESYSRDQEAGDIEETVVTGTEPVEGEE